MPKDILPLIGFALTILFFLAICIAIVFRRVVATNEVHIVQSAKATISYGKDTPNGNTYYEWPAWIPVIGINKIVLPVSVFSLQLESYAAYDVGRVPFIVDIQAFFRIKDSNLAAARISSFHELQEQLIGVLQGAARAMLASSEIEEIMQGRSAFGLAFTKEVEEQLSNWGVETVKNIELMDIRDAHDSHVIANIMEKKKSLIQMQSRVEVANNTKTAEIAEVEAVREADMKRVEAKQTVDTRVAAKDLAVGVANEQAKQEIQEQARITKEKEMAVIRVSDVKRAEITKDMGIVKAEEDKQKTVLDAEAKLASEKLNAQGIQAVGQARAEAEKAMQLAPVEAQIVLAKEIGENQGYQTYLVSLEQIKAYQTVGTHQAEALQKAEIKVIANAGNDVTAGINSIGELFTSKGGMNVGAMLETFGQTPSGKAVIEKFVGSKSSPTPSSSQEN